MLAIKHGRAIGARQQIGFLMYWLNKNSESEFERSYSWTTIIANNIKGSLIFSAGNKKAMAKPWLNK